MEGTIKPSAAAAAVARDKLGGGYLYRPQRRAVIPGKMKATVYTDGKIAE